MQKGVHRNGVQTASFTLLRRGELDCCAQMEEELFQMMAGAALVSINYTKLF